MALLGAAASYQFDLGERLGVDAPDPATDPAAVAPPAGLQLPPVPAAPLVAAESPPRAADPGAVSSALEALVVDKKLGRRVTVAVADVVSGQRVFNVGPPLVTPASTLKLATSLAALDVLGPDHRFTTSVVRAGRRLVLVGGGDPLLTRAPHSGDDYPQRADLTTLATQTAAALSADGVIRVRLAYDASLFTGPAVDPSWEPDYIPDDVVSPISALWVDEGRENEDDSDRSVDPSLAAAQFFAAVLAQHGITVAGELQAATAGAAMQQVAAVNSPPLSQVVQHTLEVSDNEAAEVLARHVALARGGDASFAGGAGAVTEVLTGLGVDLSGAVLYDGSGLSRSDRLGVQSLLDILRVAAADPALRTVVTGLPVAGWTGSLATRFLTAPKDAMGEVRAKTGTLTGVHGLAGTVVTRDGVLLTFVAIADRVKLQNTTFTRAQLDKIAGALAACTCAGTA
jgi:D-alanyl-D-alanine carboxypeptidase/D-alanyl-D-alanine-endopeptidase (penicillin-binding protein 4)